jgi:hypothetical protein
VRLPRETFRIDAEPAGHRGYFVVHVAPTARQMRATMRRCGTGCVPKQVAGCVSATCDELPDLRGVVFLAQPLGAGVVTHELAHAAFRLMDHAGVRVEHWSNGRDLRKNHRSSEERYALTLEALTRSFWNEAYRVGLVKIEVQDVA